MKQIFKDLNRSQLTRLDSNEVLLICLYDEWHSYNSMRIIGIAKSYKTALELAKKAIWGNEFKIEGYSYNNNRVLDIELDTGQYINFEIVKLGDYIL